MNPWRIGLWVAILMATLWFLWAVRGILLPFAIAFLISVLLEPAVGWMGRRKINRGIAVGLITLVFFSILGGIVVLAAPVVATQIGEVQKNVDHFTKGLAETEPGTSLTWVDRALQEVSTITGKVGITINRQQIMQQWVEPNKDEIRAGIQSFFNGFVGIVTGAASQILLLLFTPLFVILILLDMPDIRKSVRSWIPPALRRQTLSLMGEIGTVFKAYLRGVVINVTVYTLFMTLLLGCLGVKSFLLLGMMIGILYLIPGLGSFIASVAVFVAVGFSGQTGNQFLGNQMVALPSSWHFAGAVVLSMFIVGTAHDNLLTPRIVGGAVDIHPLVGMFIVFAGGALFGLPGMLLAYPVAGSLKVILERLLSVSNSTRDIVRLPAVPWRHRPAGL